MRQPKYHPNLRLEMNRPVSLTVSAATVEALGWPVSEELYAPERAIRNAYAALNLLAGWVPIETIESSELKQLFPLVYTVALAFGDIHEATNAAIIAIDLHRTGRTGSDLRNIGPIAASKCSWCGRETDELEFTIDLNGTSDPYCETCEPIVEQVLDAVREKSAQERAEYHAALTERPLHSLPEELDVAAFEEHVLQRVLHHMAAHPDKVRDLATENPMWRVPELIALELRQKVLSYIPIEWVKVLPREEWGSSGCYLFTAPVPRAVVVAACERAGL